MKLNVLSDLHLGQGALDPPDNDADVVILAGDVARPREAVAWARRIGKPVLYVAGNHEFYGDSIDGTLATLRAACAGTNIRFLDDDVAVLGGVRFVGSTLWTDFMLLGAARREEAMREGQRFLRDFSRIRARRDCDAPYTPADSAARFDVHRGFLGQRLAEPFAGPTVVITHHAPSPKSTCLWVHGHTHDSFDYVVNGTRVLCNPRGYAKDGVNENVRFDPDLLVEVA